MYLESSTLKNIATLGKYKVNDILKEAGNGAVFEILETTWVIVYQLGVCGAGKQLLRWVSRSKMSKIPRLCKRGQGRGEERPSLFSMLRPTKQKRRISPDLSEDIGHIGRPRRTIRMSPNLTQGIYTYRQTQDY